jgi:hypothetical protein
MPILLAVVAADLANVERTLSLARAAEVVRETLLLREEQATSTAMFTAVGAVVCIAPVLRRIEPSHKLLHGHGFKIKKLLNGNSYLGVLGWHNAKKLLHDCRRNDLWALDISLPGFRSRKGIHQRDSKVHEE